MAARKLPAEDALALDKVSDSEGQIKIAVPRLARIANFDDLDPLRLEEGVAVVFVQAGEPIPSDADLVLLPGSKSTMADMAFLQEQGWDIDLHAHVRRGGYVLGLCGGYQMLGQKIHDPDGIEGESGSIDGLGLLDIETVLTPKKSLVNRTAKHLASGEMMEGFEMHLGESDGPARDHPFAEIEGRAEGAVACDGQIAGTYLHGIFSSDDFRKSYLASFGLQTSDLSYNSLIDETLNQLADHMETHVDLDRLYEMAKEAG